MSKTLETSTNNNNDPFLKMKTEEENSRAKKVHRQKRRLQKQAQVRLKEEQQQANCNEEDCEEDDSTTLVVDFGSSTADITNTATSTSSPSRGQQHHLQQLSKNPTLPATAALPSGISGGSPLSLGGNGALGGRAEINNKQEGGGNNGPPVWPPYHPFYSKAASYQYRNQAGCPHQSKVEFTDVRQMESTLYQLLTDFHLGKLQAFGDGVTFENMIKVREQQENLARLHFELNLQQSNKHSFENDAFFNNSPSKVNSIISKPFSKSNMLKLIQNLQNLCKSIERLQWKNSTELEFN